MSLKLVQLYNVSTLVGRKADKLISNVQHLLELALELQHERSQKELG